MVETRLPSEVKESRAGTPLRRAIRWTALSLLVFVVVEAALFRLPWYLQYLQPNSSTGMFELSLYLLRHYRPDHVNEVLAVGDSRMAEGFSAWNATVLSGDQRLYFWNAGIAGSTPRVWYYYLRDADPNRNRFRAIVIGLDHYSDEDSYDSAQNRLTDLNYVVGRLRIGDIWDFSSSMREVPNQRAALVGATLKGTVLRRDLHEFLEDIPKRVGLEKDAHRHGLIYGQNYNGRVGNLHGLMADWQNKTLSFPAGLDEDEKAPLTRAIFPVLPSHTGELTRYRRRWLWKDSLGLSQLLHSPDLCGDAPRSFTCSGE